MSKLRPRLKNLSSLCPKTLLLSTQLQKKAKRSSMLCQKGQKWSSLTHSSRQSWTNPKQCITTSKRDLKTPTISSASTAKHLCPLIVWSCMALLCVKSVLMYTDKLSAFFRRILKIWSLSSLMICSWLQLLSILAATKPSTSCSVNSESKMKTTAT